MNSYRIVYRSEGYEFGVFEGEHEIDALLAMVRQAGHDTIHGAAKFFGQTECEFIAGYKIEIVEA